jgi:ceramide glucosyltransferase
LKGVDDLLERNLRKCFLYPYPKYEVIFSVADKNDPAIEIVEKLRRQYSEVDSTLIIGKFYLFLN